MSRNGRNAVVKGNQESVSNKKFHTLVFHVFPDIEPLAAYFLIKTYADLARMLGVKDNFSLKFIPAGPLRPEDWPGEETVTVKALSEKGYMFIDVAGGEFDHHPHGQSEEGEEQSTLDKIVAKSGADLVLSHLGQAFRKITLNDLHGTELVQDQERGNSKTPNTASHLRNIILGWNLIHRTNPAAVLALSRMAFCGISALVTSAINGNLTSDLKAVGLTPDDLNGTGLKALGESGQRLPDSAEQNKVHGEVFLAANVIAGVAIFLADMVRQGGIERTDADNSLQSFRQMIAVALNQLEDDWHQGEADYWSANTVVQELVRVIPTGRGNVTKDVVLVVGTSSSIRYSAVSRRGNRGQNRPSPERETRQKADITIQFAPGKDCRFVISSRHIALDKIAAVIRGRDLRAKGVDVSKFYFDDLRVTGHLSFRNGRGQEVQALLLAYDKAFGNNFRANPFGPDCALTKDQVVEAVVYALTNPI